MEFRRTLRRRGKWVSGLLAAAAIAIAVTGLSAGTAAAQSASGFGTGPCPSQTLCLYDAPDFGQAYLSYHTTDGTHPGTEAIGSIINNTDSRWCLYTGTNFSGLTFEIHAGNQWPNLPSYMINNAPAPGVVGSFKPGPCPTVIGQIKGYDGRCLAAISEIHAPVGLDSCSDAVGEQWQVSTKGTGTISGQGYFASGDYCMGAYKAGTKNGTKVDIYACNGTTSQVWIHKSDNELVDKHAGKCLDDTNRSTTGAQLEIWSCTGAANQKFDIPS